MGEYEQYLSQFNIDDAREMSEEAPGHAWRNGYFGIHLVWCQPSIPAPPCSTHTIWQQQKDHPIIIKKQFLYSHALKMIHIKLLKLRIKAWGENRTIPTIKTELQHWWRDITHTKETKHTPPLREYQGICFQSGSLCIKKDKVDFIIQIYLKLNSLPAITYFELPQVLLIFSHMPSTYCLTLCFGLLLWWYLLFPWIWTGVFKIYKSNITQTQCSRR